MNKPSKKTEWLDKMNELGVPLCDGNHPRLGCERERVLELAYFLLHQRDNEIREKIQGMKKESVRGYAISERYLHQWIKGYNKAIDDLLTYLLNRE